MISNKDFSRRHFIRIAGIVTGSAALGALAACSDNNISPTAGITPIISTAKPTVLPVGNPIDSYMALAPGTMRAGQVEKVSVSLFSGAALGTDNVKVDLLLNGQSKANVTGVIQGRGDLALNLPALSEGTYTLQLATSNFQAQAQVKVESGTLVFLETDKPIYKPGQTVHIRAIALDTRLIPVSEQVTVEVQDAKGIKIYKKNLQTDEYGMATADLPLSSEPNLGTWKISGVTGKRRAQLDIRIEKYVLPKYEITTQFAKGWALVNEPIKGTIKAEYSYGKAVQGEAEIHAFKYTGTWQEFSTLTKTINGQVDFELPAVNYVVGVPGAGGQGNVRLEVTVREKDTGYEEKTTELLTIASAPITLKVIPESVIFKPALPLSLLLVAQTPDKSPADAQVSIEVIYTKADYSTSRETRQAEVKQGTGSVKVNPPGDAISLTLSASSNTSSGKAYTSLTMQAGYSPSGNFISLQQVSKGGLKVGDTANFKVNATKQASGFYYEIMAHGTLVFSDYAASPDLAFTVTPQMAPQARLLVYQIMPNAEVAADYLPFSVEAGYTHKVEAKFDKEEVEPGQEVNLSLKTEGAAKVGVAVVDRSVFILAENRLNLQQVFDELEKLYQQPQIELHDAQPVAGNVMPGGSGKMDTLSSKEMFANAGVVVLTNKNVPQGKSYQQQFVAEAGGVVRGAPLAAAPTMAAATTAAAQNSAVDTSKAADQVGTLAEVQRVRQFFPETWIWEDFKTGADGTTSKKFQVPDSITTWMLHAVALSPKLGMGMAEAQLKVLQPFFVTVDLVYSAIRGEQFPVKVALYNYTAQDEQFTVELNPESWFELLDQGSKTVKVGANGTGGVSFTIKAKELGTKQLKVTARSRNRADAVIKELLIEPEGVAREVVENYVVTAGKNLQLDMNIPAGIVAGSARAYLAVTGNYLTQTIEGLENLLRMPYGCGEQNMILFAPNVFVARYLKETGQIKPELQAKAESLMVTGYQRELTYQRTDGSFSAFGNSDNIGSLWLSAFVLKTLAIAKDFIYIDDNVLSVTRNWLLKQQKADGSFEPVGFLHHQDLLGGLKGNQALTAYLAVALQESGDKIGAGKAIAYLEKNLDGMSDPYTLALTSYALELAKSGQAGKASDMLVKLAKQDENGLYWGELEQIPVNPQTGANRYNPPNRSATIETTGYALLALVAHGDRVTAAQAARWLVSKRNSYGGWDSTQDTVVGLQALSQYVAGSKTDVDATLTFRNGNWQKEVRVNPDNADVLQTIEAQLGGTVSVEIAGRGQAVLQTVRRFNVPEAERKEQATFQLSVDYGASQIELSNQLNVKATVQFTPPEPIKAGMVVLDVALPTGFAPVTDTLVALAKQQPKIKRYDVAGRKVILYIEDMSPNETLTFEFKAVALYPIKAQAVTSQAYSYYRPDWKGESLGGAIVVNG
jgi:CD109 antigen